MRRLSVYISKVFSILDNLVVRLVFYAKYCASLCLVLILTIGTLKILAYNLLGWVIPATIEGSEVLLATSLFLGLCNVQHRQENIRLGTVRMLMPRRVQSAFELLGLVLGTIIFAVLTYQSYNLALKSLIISETANALIAFPIYPAKFLIAAGAAIATAEFLRQLVHGVVGVAQCKPPSNDRHPGE